MRKLLLPLLAALAAAPAAAQQGLNPVVDVRHAAPPRAVYLAALDALEKYGYQLRVRFLDQALLTLPAFASAQPKPDEEASQLAVEVAPAGDSTRLVIAARLVRGDGRPVDTGDDKALSRVLVAEVTISAAIDTALQALAPGAGKPDPREDSDAYGYGRRNPVRVGGAGEDGVRREHQYLENLRGPGGERVRWRRLGSCCEFTAPVHGMLDAYQVTYDGLAQPVVLYLDMYTPITSVPPPPEGFTAAPPPTRSGGG
ncbi:MAG TPA: hypothetical protein VF746_00805 [Longimicrobium sp.]|jgi:hypothetical protein